MSSEYRYPYKDFNEAFAAPPMREPQRPAAWREWAERDRPLSHALERQRLADEIARGALVWAQVIPGAAWSYAIPRAAELYCSKHSRQWWELVRYAQGYLAARESRS